MWGSILFDDSFFSVLKGSLAALEAEEFGARRVFDELAFCHDVPRISKPFFRPLAVGILTG